MPVSDLELDIHKLFVAFFANVWSLSSGHFVNFCAMAQHYFFETVVNLQGSSCIDAFCCCPRFTFVFTADHKNCGPRDRGS